MTAKLKFPNPHIYILNAGGCHGHYLTYLIDRLSADTPSITELPFNNLGNSHIRLAYSGYARFLDVDQYQDKNLKESNIIKLIYPNEILYYERVAMARAGDANRDLHNLQLDISFMETYNKVFYEKIKKIYNVSSNRVPKFILRDAYKTGFLDWSSQGSVVSSKEDIGWINNNLKDNNNLYLFEVNKFFSLESISKELKIIDERFGLNLNLEELEYVHTEFMKRNKILNTQQRTDQVLDAVSNNKNIEIPELDILQQAYVYARLEKNNDFITMPMTETFFTDTQEIIDYINYYPEHYKAMNPNLPIFNNIPNPFFLHRQNNK
jgi:hypothetical protein